jgi:transcriptional regulator with XRE-family HTH domain
MAGKKPTKRKRYQNPVFLKALGEHCKKMRIQRGYSIDRLSKEGEMLSPAVIHRLESGNSDVQITVLLRIAMVLEIPVNELLELGRK